MNDNSQLPLRASANPAVQSFASVQPKATQPTTTAAPCRPHIHINMFQSHTFKRNQRHRTPSRFRPSSISARISQHQRRQSPLNMAIPNQFHQTSSLGVNQSELLHSQRSRYLKSIFILCSQYIYRLDQRLLSRKAPPLSRTRLVV